MSETAEMMADAFEAEANTAPVVNVSGVDAPTVTSGKNEPTQKFYTEEDLAKVRSQEKEKLYPEIDRLKEEVSIPQERSRRKSSSQSSRSRS